MNIGRKSLSLILAAALMLGVVSIGGSTASVVTADAADYYSGITATKGTQLLGQLHDLIVGTHSNYTSYDECKTYASKTDPSLDGKGILEFYTHETMTTGFGSSAGILNREHVWPQSLGNWKTSNAGSDLHHIRPTETRLNGDRGNKKYGEVTNGTPQYSRTTSGANSELGGYANSSTFMPLDNVKGDVARIVMYVYTHYNTASNVGGTKESRGSGALTFTRVISASSENAAKQLLIEWNESDPVDSIERTRNEAVYAIQGNRNPFIDHPEYASMIWGDGSYVPPDPPVTVAPTSLSLTPSAVTMSVGETANLSVTASPANASKAVKWSVSPTNVVTIVEGKLTAYAEGQATVTATSTLDSTVKATAQVTVKKSEGGGTANSFTITIDSFDLTEGYGFKTWSAGGVKGTAFIFGGSGEYSSTGMQFNKSKTSYYLASTTATNGPIKSVTVKANAASQTDREWKLLTSSSAYGEVTGKPTNGNDHGTQFVTTNGTKWEVSGSDTFFALTYEFAETKGASYLDSITVEYAASQGGDPTPPPPPEHQHVFEYEDYTDETHLVGCETCTDYLEEEPHVYSSDTDTTCDLCGHERHVHDYKWVDKDDTSHVWKCEGCGEVSKTEEHIYTDDTDTTCNKCDHVRTVHTHSYQWEDNDETTHVWKCEGCGEISRTQAHEYTDDADTTCNVCGHERTLPTEHEHAFEYTDDDNENTHRTTCKEGDYDAREPHVYSGDTDTTCNLCGYVRTVHAHSYQWVDEGEQHALKCEGCGDVKSTSPHEYSDAADTTCDSCGHVREVNSAVFHEAVQKITGEGSLSDRLASIKEAAEAYATLTDEEKALASVKKDHAKFEEAVEALNAELRKLNEAAKSANGLFVSAN